MVVELKNTDYEYKVKSGRYTLFLIVLFVVFLLIGAKIGPNIFILFILIIITILPILILFRKSLVNYLPDSIAKSLLEIDKRNENKKTEKKSISKLVKEVGHFITITIILISAIILIVNINKNLKLEQIEKPQKFKDSHKLLVALFLVLLSGSIVMEI